MPGGSCRVLQAEAPQSQITNRRCDLAGDGLGATDILAAVANLAQERLAGDRRPAAFAPDAVVQGLVAGEGGLAGLKDFKTNDFKGLKDYKTTESRYTTVCTGGA